MSELLKREMDNRLEKINILEAEIKKLKQALEHSMNYMSESAQAEVNMIARGES